MEKVGLNCLIKLSLVSVLTFCPRGDAKPLEAYMRAREKIFADEESSAIGGHTFLKNDEHIANRVLMNAKKLEFDAGFRTPTEFLPMQNFLVARKNIEKSTVFRILQLMPKGGLLHVHERAMVSTDFLVDRITYEPNLYVCRSNGVVVKFRFFNKPDSNCPWENLEEVRKKENGCGEIDRMLRKQLSMETEDPTREYAEIDETWKKFESIFDLVGPLLTHLPVFKMYVYQALLELYKDNVLYVEIRTGFSGLYELDGTVHDVETVLQVYREVVQAFQSAYPDFIGVKFIYSKPRILSRDELAKNIEKVQNLMKNHKDIIVGFDLIGQEDKAGSLIDFVEQFQNADIPYLFHAGETNWYGQTTDENLVDAVLLGTKRIGHGYAVPKHPSVMNLLKRSDIAIELSPISNQVLKLVADMRNHPAAYLLANDYPVVITNDDPSFWGAKGLSYDFYEAFMGMMSKKADLRALKVLAMNSIHYSQMTPDEKEMAFRTFNFKWQIFIRKVISFGH